MVLNFWGFEEQLKFKPKDNSCDPPEALVNGDTVMS